MAFPKRSILFRCGNMNANCSSGTPRGYTSSIIEANITHVVRFVDPSHGMVSSIVKYKPSSNREQTSVRMMVVDLDRRGHASQDSLTASTKLG